MCVGPGGGGGGRGGLGMVVGGSFWLKQVRQAIGFVHVAVALLGWGGGGGGWRKRNEPWKNMFVATNTCLSRQNFHREKISYLWQFPPVVDKIVLTAQTTAQSEKELNGYSE